MLTDFKGIFFVAVCAIIVVSLIVINNRKRYLLFLLVLFFPFSTGLIFYRFHGIMLTDFPLIILLFLLGFDKKKFHFPKEAIPVFILVAWGFISAHRAMYPGFAYSESLRFLRGVLVFLVIANGVKSIKDIQFVMKALFIGLFFQSLLSFYQWRFGYFGLSFLGETSWVSWRTRGTFTHESYFGNYLIMLVPIVFRLFVYYRPPKKSTMKINGLLLALGLFALFTSMTRGPWLSFVLAITCMIVYSLLVKKLRPKVLTPLIILAVFGAGFMFRYIQSIVNQFGEDRRTAAEIRLPLNRVAIRAIKANPIFGVGLGNYKSACHQYVVPEAEPDLPNWQIEQLKWDWVHNSFLLITAEAGLIGGFMFLLFLVMNLLKGKKIIKSLRNPYLLNLNIGIITGLVAIFIAFQFSPDIHIHQINVGFFLLNGLIVAIYHINLKQSRQLKLNAHKIRKEKMKYEDIRNF